MLSRVSTLDHTNIETSIEQALVPYINKENILKINIEKDDTQPKNDIVLKVSKNRVKVIEVNGEKVPPKKLMGKSAPAVRPTNALHPTVEKIREFFLAQKSSEVEVQKFFNYFQSNGWKVGGKAPMQDWQAAAGNWILNIQQFSQQPKMAAQKQLIPGNLNATTGKNYSEPL